MRRGAIVYRLSRSYNVTPWLVKEYIYCPMIPWIITHYNIESPPTVSMEEGLRMDADAKKEMIREAGVEYSDIDYEKEYVLEDNTYIKVDAIAWKKTPYGRKGVVIEIKRYRRKHDQHQRQQVKTYAYLLTRNGIPVHQAVLIQEGRIRYRKRIEQLDLEEVEYIIKQVEKIIKSDQPPYVQPTRKCWSCWYRKICPIH